MNSSKDRNTFQKFKYIERKAAEGKTVENDTTVKKMVEYFENIPSEIAKKESKEEFKKNNLEYDLRSTKWICDKAKEREEYAQNLYAAMCNNEFIRNDVWPLLKKETWSCSWRYAGGIIADMREEGDYIDWYCSGIKFHPEDVKDNETLTEEQKVLNKLYGKYVGEGIVTDEIRQDLFDLGWIVIDDDNLV